MKITSIIVLLSISLCASLCCSEEEDIPNTNGTNYNLVNDNIIQVEANVSTINAGETIYIETTINTIQTNQNNEEIDLTNLFPEDTKMGYQLVLYTVSTMGNMSSVGLGNESLVVLEGETVVDVDPDFNFVNVLSTLNSNEYRNKFGITIQEPGTYWLGARFFHNNNGRISINNASDTTNRIWIQSAIVNSNIEGLYEFTVN